MRIELGSTAFDLLPEKALYRIEDKTLIIADLHLGKAMHFRKAGIFMPQQSAERDYERLHAMIGRYEPEQVYFLGDLFHSDHNSEWKNFELFIHLHPDVHFVLIRGNHDVLKREHYDSLGITVVDDYLLEDNIIYSHAPMEDVNTYNIAGHIHPGCSISGLGRQRLKLPCYYHKAHTFLLPAFGSLTGLYLMPKDEDARFFCIVNDGIVAL